MHSSISQLVLSNLSIQDFFSQVKEAGYEAVDSDIGRVVLEPFEVHPAEPMDRMVGIFHILVEIQAEMAVVPVRGLRIVFLTAVPFRAPA